MFPVLKRIKIRQWAPLFALAVGLAAAAIGAAVGQPNSWLWFGGGIIAALVIVAISYERKYRKA
jgi:bacteriorhodopsin